MPADSTIATDVQPSDFAVDDNGENAFLTSFEDEDKKKSSTGETDGATDTEDTETTSETEETTDKGESDETDAETKDPDPDDTEFEVKVGDKIEKATLRDLKRLFGQEASLTQKSQALADARRIADEKDTRANVALNSMLERAQARHKPYADLDMLVLSQRMDTETFEALRKDAAAAKADVDFITQELDGHVKAASERTQAAFKQSAQEAIKALGDTASPHYIEGWGQPLYNDMMTFAAENGLPEMRQSTSPAAIKLLNMAMLYARAQAASKTAEKKVAKVVENAKRVIKPGASRDDNSTRSVREAMSKLRQSGDLDDATEAFAATF